MYNGKMTVQAIKQSLQPSGKVPEAGLQPVEVPAEMPDRYSDVQAVNFWHICQHLKDNGQLHKVSLIYVNAVVMAIDHLNRRDNAMQWVKVLHAALELLELKISHVRALGIEIDDDLWNH